MYPLEDIEVPEDFLRSYPYKKEIGAYGTQRPDGSWAMQRDENLAPHPRTEYSVKVNRQEYYAIISHMDEQIGRILAKLKAIGEMDNTYIFFTADHGLSCGHHGLLGKQNMYEVSLKVPFMVVGPDIPKGESRDANIYLQDVMATSLDIAGVKKPDYVEFSSLLPLIEDPKKEGPLGDTVYFAYEMDLQRMIKVGDYKLFVYPQANLVRLFNLADDPYEMNDLAGDVAQWPRIRKMFHTLLQKQVEMEDGLDLKTYFPQLVSH
jgi:arylsulfatase A-like enzyme